jgi:ABC-type transporter Mla subunit MlaD
MPATNLFQELRDVLQDFKDFLDENVPTIQPAIQALASLIPQIVELIDLLVGLLDQLKTEVENLDVSAIPGLSEVSEFTGKINGLVEAARALLPDDAEEDLEEVLEVASVVGSLPSLDQVRGEIVTLIDAVVAHLQSLRPSS